MSLYPTLMLFRDLDKLIAYRYGGISVSELNNQLNNFNNNYWDQSFSSNFYFNVSNCCNDTDNDKYQIVKYDSQFQNKLNFMDLINDQSLVDNLNENYNCIICYDLIYPAVSLECGHSFCKRCIDKYCEKNIHIQNKCPLCRKIFFNNNNTHNIKINNILRDLKCKCPINNCNWIGKLFELDNHLSICQIKNKNIICKWCKLPMELKYFENHIINDCEYKKIKCKYCHSEGPEINLKNHHLECQEYPRKCTYCNKSFSRNNFDNHKDNQCKLRPVYCEFCDHIFKFNEIFDHELLCSYYPINCEKCNCIIPKKKLRNHMKKLHSNRDKTNNLIFQKNIKHKNIFKKNYR